MAAGTADVDKNEDLLEEASVSVDYQAESFAVSGGCITRCSPSVCLSVRLSVGVSNH